MKFIHLTALEQTAAGIGTMSVFIRPELVAIITTPCQGTLAHWKSQCSAVVYTLNGGKVEVKETPDAITDMLDEAEF